MAIGGGVQEEDDATDEETGPDSVNARVREGGKGGRFDDISSIDRATRQRGDTAVISRTVHGGGGRSRMGSVGGGSSTAAATSSPGVRGVAGVGGY